LEDLEIKVGQGNINIDDILDNLGHAHRLSLRSLQHIQYGADCCHPIPGDAVLGRMVKNHGMELHYRDCPHVLESDGEAWMEVDWHAHSERLHPTAIEVYTEDLCGMLSQVTGLISQAQANINDVHLEQRAGQMTHIYILVSVRDRIHLAKILRGIRLIDGVIKVNRKNHRELKPHRGTGIGDTVAGMFAKGRRSLLKSTKKIRGKSS